MKKIFSLILAFALFLSISACSDNNEPLYENSEEYSEPSTEISLRHIELDTDEGQAVCNAVGKYLDTFISADFEAIQNVLHEDDKIYFNFESEEQKELYKLIFPKLKYEFHYVSEHKGTYGVMTTMTSPDMADVYGALITENIDKSIAGQETAENAREQNNIRMRELLSSSEISERVEDLYIYVEYINGEYIPRCEEFLANELVGGAVEAQSEISDTLNEAIYALGE